ncbi:hypothetical protein GPJ56_002549 [Histomonas meleagridis]|uniref:uncharacterized protein n=1 Tax=Histomonas meleagridis TaxID=135588 RepID=UPI003559D8A8|nr:hypothetical protein GPJ56_002549 [Histomonas meleagridis]KAH0801341.1 hypothetical protein GO595_005936 [Histomonas meleagridis]
MQQELRGYQIELATKQYGYFKDRIEQSHEIIQLLQSDIIPTDYMCCVCSEFFEYLEPESSSRLQNSIKYLYYYVERTKSHIETLPKAPWHQDFRPFFTQLVIDSRSRVISDISYIFPMEIEVSLSQCFFCYKSPYQYEIDLLINTFTKVDHATFTRELIDFALRIIPKRASLTPQEQSIAFVILYRCLFQRCYERFPHYFAPKPNPNLIKLEKLASLPSKYFHLPTEYIHVGDGEESIRNLFRNINFYHSASLFLYESIFCPNPIDALYYIHKELIGVQKAAIIIQKGSNLASLSDIKQLICFDDLFSLFLGTTLSSEHPDIFYTFWMIDSFLDKESLSPPFEYAERNFEGLISHCQSIDLESYVKENE